jgi:hypothetical protein
VACTDLLRDLRSVHDGDPDGQLWAKAMARHPADAKTAAEQARADGLDALPTHQLARIRNRYLGALAHGHSANLGKRGLLADEAPALRGHDPPLRHRPRGSATGGRFRPDVQRTSRSAPVAASWFSSAAAAKFLSPGSSIPARRSTATRGAYSSSPVVAGPKAAPITDRVPQASSTARRSCG